jgi:hypothetical protein
MSLTTIVSTILIIVILIALVYTYYFFNPTLLNQGEVIAINNGDATKGRKQKRLAIGIQDFNEPEAIRYFYDGWLRINSTPDQSKTYVIFNRGNDFMVTLTGHKLSITYSYYRDNKKYLVSTDAQTESGGPSTYANAIVGEDGELKPPKSDGDWHKTAGGNTSGKHTTILDIATNFPFQKWVYFCINVDERTMDVYLNGKLTKSVTNPPDANKPSRIIDFTKLSGTFPITIGNNYVQGGLSRFRREPGNMDPQSVWNTYIQGPGATGDENELTGDYHAKISLLKNNSVRRSVTLF